MSDKKEVAICLVAASLLVMKMKKKRKKRALWSKEWFLQRNVSLTTDCHLLRELNESSHVDYRNYLRMDEITFKILLNKVAPLIQKRNTHLREAISPENRLIATLRFLATGRSFEDLKFSMRISPQALGKIINETCIAICTALKPFIQVGNNLFDIKNLM